LDKIAETVDAAIRQSGFPVQDIQCRTDGQSLLLVGQATRYYHVQIALTLAMEHAQGCRVIPEVDVVTILPS